MCVIEKKSESWLIRLEVAKFWYSFYLIDNITLLQMKFVAIIVSITLVKVMLIYTIL